MKITTPLCLLALCASQSSASGPIQLDASALKKIDAIDRLSSSKITPKFSQLFSRDIRSGLADARKLSAPTKAIKQVVKMPFDQSTASDTDRYPSLLDTPLSSSANAVMSDLKWGDTLVSKSIQKRLFNKNFKQGMHIDLTSNLISGSLKRLSDKVLEPLPIPDGQKSVLHKGAAITGNLAGKMIATALIKRSCNPAKILASMAAGKVIDQSLQKAGEQAEVIKPHIEKASPFLLYQRSHT